MLKGLPKVFCVGGDVKSFIKSMSRETISHSGMILDLIANYDKPIVVLIEGLALGGAAICSMTAKYRVVTEKTTFAMPETAIGYFTDSGASIFLSRLERNLGVYMALTGARISGSDMIKSKLATHFVESVKLEELEKKLIVCKTHDDVVEVLKAFSSTPRPFETEIDLCLPQVEKCFGSSTVEEIFENLERDGSEWAKKTIKTLNKMSPSSLKVTHRLIKLGRESSLRENLKMEFRLVKYYLGTKNSFGRLDMSEGIRAMLVEKDFKPKWNPKTLAEVTDERVDEFFKVPADKSELVFENKLRGHL